MAEPTITLGGVTLPGDLQWTDEHAWSAVARSDPAWTLTGALLVEEAVKQAGRPITLTAADNRAWIDAATLASLRGLNATPGWTGTLTLADGRTFTVAFRAEGIRAEPIVFQSPSGAHSGWWQVTLTLIEV